MKVVVKKVPQDSKLAVGQVVDLKASEIAVLEEAGHELESEATVKARAEAEAAKKDAEAIKAKALESGKATIIAAVERAKARQAVAPKDEAVQARALKQFEAGADVDFLVEYIDAMQAKSDALGQRQTQPEGVREVIIAGDTSLRETVKAYLKANEPFQKQLKLGGIVRAAKNDTKALIDAHEQSAHRSEIGAQLVRMVNGGGEITRAMVDDIVRAGDYVDPASNNPLGVLNTGLLLQQNLGFLANQLAILDDITTDISSQPALFNTMVRTRYLTIPKVMLKSATNAWPTTGSPTGNSVDVNVTMNVHAGVPISINNNILSATPRQLFNEQRQPMLYSLAEYIIYKLIYNAYNGNTRYANDGATTSTIAFNPGYTNAAAGHTFSLAGASLATFTADIPEAMDESKFPGGDEAPGDPLSRFLWVHGRAYATLAGDTNFMLNQSIWGAVAKQGGNLLETGRYERVGNLKIRKSQLVTDKCTATGTGADSTTNGIVVSPGTFANATYIGFGGTRSALLFVSRVPQDYTQVLPDVPSTAAIEMVTEPRTGLTFLVVKFLDHAYETANMRVQLMFGTAIGDERQGMLFTRE